MKTPGAIGEVVAIIPARGGSKGIPCKNIRPLGGKPLIAWAIESALAEPGISRVVVSTDDQDIAAVAKEYGAWVPFLRPPHMAQDTSTIHDAIGYTVSRMINELKLFVRAIIVLYPTSPFRRQELLQMAVSAMASSDVMSFNTLKPVAGPIGRFVVRDGQVLQPLKQRNNSTCGYYRPYGLVQGWSLSKGANHLQSHRYAVIDDPVQLIDIDTDEDFQRAEIVLQEGLRDFAKP